MNHVLLFSLLCLGILPVNRQIVNVKSGNITADLLSCPDNNTLSMGNQPDPDSEKMLAVIFRSQDFCRAELKDFIFDVQFNIVSATVYFSGTNFKNVETGYITSNSLKPIRSLMARCAPGSMVVFDNVKAIGPDKLIRPIQGTSYVLR